MLVSPINNLLFSHTKSISPLRAVNVESICAVGMEVSLNRSTILRKGTVGKKLREYAAVYSTGAMGYTIIEILWRGFTHWTMFFVGGACFLAIYITELFSSSKKLWRRCFAGCLTITAIEFVSGCLINLVFKWNVWDYSKVKPQFMGQICLLYSALWFFLCIPLCSLCKFFRKVFR